MNKIGLGGGCHWCTEAIFQQVPGVRKVEQGWIGSIAPHEHKSEGVIVTFDDSISLETLIHIHLQTHSSTCEHAFRKKYRSAIYYLDEETHQRSEEYLAALESNRLITQVLPLVRFEANQEKYLDYYAKNPDAPFCQRYITPKIEVVRKLVEERKAL